jgi:PLD-like domain/Domain of unknown function (DUF1998)
VQRASGQHDDLARVPRTRPPPPKGFEPFFEDVLLVERIREVRALLGFTRVESNADFAEATVVADGRLTKLTRESPKWLPASEVRGEGIFLRIREEALQKWEVKPEVQELEREFFKSHQAWRTLRKLKPANEGFPGIRLVLLHSLSHALMRQIVLDCGYTAASVRERLYSRETSELGGPMAGILLYTAAPDSEGTLGGLVELGTPPTLGRHLQQAFESMRICASDPLCSEHRPDVHGRGIQGACCHACQFSPETSCERGNRYYDAMKAFPAALIQATQIYYWPVEKRERNPAGRPGKLHAKIAIVDNFALVSSANLTDDAFNRNLELGIMVRSPEFVSSTKRYFESLIAEGTLKRL